jgi:CRP-like cAMP-binding protein
MKYLLNQNSNRFFGKAITAHRLFSDISLQALQSLKKITKPVIFKKDQKIIDVGNSPRYIFFIIKGNAHSFLNPENKKEIFVRNIKPNEILGLIEAVSSFKYEIGVKTDSYCLCECVKREDFLDFLYVESSVCFKLLRILSNNLQNSYQNFSSTITY